MHSKQSRHSAAPFCGDSLLVRGVLIALALAACGDNAPPPRLTLARYIYEDGTAQIDHERLFDRGLDRLCAPTRFSDGNTYCMPVADDAFYVDDHCSRAAGQRTPGSPPSDFFVTHYRVGGERLPSHVYRAGAAIIAPAQRWEAEDGACLGPFTVVDGLDYFALGDLVDDLPRVRFAGGDTVGELHVEDLVAHGIREPWRITGCTITAAPDQGTTVCAPSDAALVSYFGDAECTMPIVTALDRPTLAYVDDALSGCRQYYGIGNELATSTLYIVLDGNCLASSISGPSRFFTVAQSVQLPPLPRVPQGMGRMRPIALGALPIPDVAMFDSELGADCLRDASGTCVPATAARVETWFADPLCGTPIDVAMVPTGSCDPPASYAAKLDARYPVLGPYTPQLYQLEPGDRCGTYTPPVPFVAHSIGPALGAEAFAHATLSIE